MATAIRCDRCNAVVERNGVYAALRLSLFCQGAGEPGSTVQKDLCEPCMSHVARVLNARPAEPSR
jgi:hypothetical protein